MFYDGENSHAEKGGLKGKELEEVQYLYEELGLARASTVERIGGRRK